MDEYWKDLEGTYWQNDELVLSVVGSDGSWVEHWQGGFFTVCRKEISGEEASFYVQQGKGQEVVGQGSEISTAGAIRVVCGFGARGCQF